MARQDEPTVPWPFLRAKGAGRELVVGQWGMIPPNSKTHIPTGKDGKRLSTVNRTARKHGQVMDVRRPWRKGQRCIIPAQSYVEPYWGTGKHIPWQFSRADAEPWGLAGLWAEWTDPDTGSAAQLHHDHAELRQRAGAESLMHRLDPEAGTGHAGQAHGGAAGKGGLGRVAAWHGGAGRGTDRAAGAGLFKRCQRPGAADHLAIAFVSNVITKMGFGLFFAR